MKKNFDLVIIGMGSTAVAASREARRLGKTVAFIEENMVGGTCLNYGCVPSKFLIEAASVYHKMKAPPYKGLSSSSPSIDFGALIKQKDEIVLNYRANKLDSVINEDDGAYLIRGKAQFIEENIIDVDGEVITGERFLIATGSTPLIPEITNLDNVDYITSDLLTTKGGKELKRIPESLIILGGGYISLELGQMFARFGSQVTILEQSDQLLSEGYEPELGKGIADHLRAEGVEIVCNATVILVEQNGICSVKAKDGKEYKSEKLLIATGRRGNTEALNLDKCGVTLSKNGFVKVDKHLKTSVSHIYAAGDVIGSQFGNQMATPVGIKDGRVAVHNAFSSDDPQETEHDILPRAIFTEPELSMVGKTEAQMQEEGCDFSVRMIPMSYVPRAVLKQESDGFIKLISDGEDKIVGATMMGPAAAEVIQSVALSMAFHAKLKDVRDKLYIYPSMAESLKIAAKQSALAK